MSEPSIKRTKTSIPSAGSWSETEENHFNYKFKLFKGENKFNDFFGTKPSLDPNLEKWLSLDWTNENHCKDMDKLQLELLNHIRLFELKQSEATVEESVRTIMKILN